MKPLFINANILILPGFGLSTVGLYMEKTDGMVNAYCHCLKCGLIHVQPLHGCVFSGIITLFYSCLILSGFGLSTVGLLMEKTDEGFKQIVLSLF